jgi:hypothetical protein
MDKPYVHFSKRLSKVRISKSHLINHSLSFEKLVSFGDSNDLPVMEKKPMLTTGEMRDQTWHCLFL